MGDNSITVPWPPLALGEDGWRRRLEDLAARAELLVSRPDWAGLRGLAGMALP